MHNHTPGNLYAGTNHLFNFSEPTYLTF